MSNSFGRLFRMTSFGESHGVELGVVLDGVPAGIEFSVEDLLPELARRRPGQSELTTARDEADAPRIVSGLFEGKTTGMPITVLVANSDQRSGDYARLRTQFRPGHADETYAGKYKHRDHRGGGRSSGRETVARVIAGVVARKILPAEVRIVAHALQIGPHVAGKLDVNVIDQNRVRCGDADVAVLMEEYIARLKDAGDSTGGIVEVVVYRPPAHLGEPVFHKLKSRLADALLSIGAVTGFSFGVGFDVATLRGLDYIGDRAHFGGILGGISTGEDLRMKVAVKPTSSVGDVAKRGRHDPCIVPRIVPVVEAMVAIVLADAWLIQRAYDGIVPPLGGDREVSE